MRKWTIKCVMIGSIVGIIALSGCSKEVGTEAQLEQEVKELEQ